VADLLIPAGYQCGCLPRTTPVGELFPRTSDVMDVMTRDELIDLIDADQVPDLSPMVTRIKDQAGTNGCTSNATTQAVEMGYRIASNTTSPAIDQAVDAPYIEFSAASIYKQCNGGRDAGSAVDANLAALAEVGPLPVEGTEGFAHTFPRNDWRRPFPRGYKETAGQFRAKEWSDADGLLAAATAAAKGFPLVFAVWWTRTSGHALVACKLKRDTRGRLGFKFPNSWGLDYGDQGFGTLWEDKLTDGIRTFGAWALRVLSRGGHPVPPVPYLAAT